ncbi:TetR family transcriptional regulator [Sphaerisporangium melleum]|uniref:TetR family transcriptional regulator n=1 Tax=Sphaerisporangium melleum TaxID=321316 RepID=A0A917VPX4_9ACTN|nr:TetR/AcrR family transcriptional regulator [Sphaerisporangium melleum]GGL02853.1 TetR family transcriptional regulator [Sphaerisporangium melleum]GII69472.1 TetR family transcriptional regulator [Sphaerisporangium melleum]
MRTLTRKGAATRQRIIEGAAAHIREFGVAATTLDDVLAMTATSKSQMFHYFPGGREELLLAVAGYEADRVLDDQRPELGELTSWPAWRSWRDKVVERYRGQGEQCPINTVLSAAGAHTPGARAVLVELMRRWQDEIATGIRHMQRAGEADPGLDADQAASALLAGIQGGVLIHMATGQTTHLEAALDNGIAQLRAGKPSSDR